ncbi:unnamed protein product [Leptidea sinapis]|uniref:Uncharacterized protein n=1 Tax=Leptidea sinapis TaxID=189913 RepID=A0A5E4QP85_9NEOP|nr:unnamed protein product [Leptidea sinapis]
MEKAKAYIKSKGGGAASPGPLVNGTSAPASPAPSPAAAVPAVTTPTAAPAPRDSDERVCFVCGGTGFSDYFTVRVKPSAQSSEPYFPFLGAHCPPAGYREAEGAEGSGVRACCVCYTFLRQQWEHRALETEYSPPGLAAARAVIKLPPVSPACDTGGFQNRSRADPNPYLGTDQPIVDISMRILSNALQYFDVPVPSRVPTLPGGKGVDTRLAPQYNVGADMSFQGEYAAQVLGLGAEGPAREDAPPAPTPAPTPPAPRPVTTTAASAALTSAASPKDNHTAKFNNARFAAGGGAAEGVEGVLDLRAREPSVISVGSQHSVISEPAGYLDAVRSTVSVYSGNSNSSSDRDILDLSMPDKNCMTEVCYVCGDEYRRGTLANLHTKEPKDKCTKQPYFPIFGEQHPRPPRSRPKDAQGTVRACAACHHHLLHQWNAYQWYYRLTKCLRTAHLFTTECLIDSCVVITSGAFVVCEGSKLM